VAATIIQVLGMEILVSIFDVAEKHGSEDRFQLVVFRHDGATLSFNEKTKMPRAHCRPTSWP
jgi:hypothetical protein